MLQGLQHPSGLGDPESLRVDWDVEWLAGQSACAFVDYGHLGVGRCFHEEKRNLQIAGHMATNLVCGQTAWNAHLDVNHSRLRRIGDLVVHGHNKSDRFETCNTSARNHAGDPSSYYEVGVLGQLPRTLHGIVVGTTAFKQSNEIVERARRRCSSASRSDTRIRLTSRETACDKYTQTCQSSVTAEASIAGHWTHPHLFR